MCAHVCGWVCDVGMDAHQGQSYCIPWSNHTGCCEQHYVSPSPLEEQYAPQNSKESLWPSVFFKEDKLPEDKVPCPQTSSALSVPLDSISQALPSATIEHQRQLPLLSVHTVCESHRKLIP